MSLGPDEFRDVMGRLAGGVTVVTAVDAGGEPRGFTATAVCSVSLEPPLALVCVGREGNTGTAIRETGRYALNFLAAGSRGVSDRFAGTDGEKFRGLSWSASPGGAPLLPGTLAWAECEVAREVEAGDHTIFVGRVVDGDVLAPDGLPLVHYASRYHQLTRPWP